MEKAIIKRIDATLDCIIENYCSVSRYGDGEFTIIQGNSNRLQEKNEELGKRLTQILLVPATCHIVCSSDIFGNQKNLKDSSRAYNKGLLRIERKSWLKLFDINRIYYNSFLYYNMFEDKTPCSRLVEKCKKTEIKCFADRRNI